MPNIKSAKKRVEVTKRNKEINKSNRSELNTAIKNFNKVVFPQSGFPHNKTNFPI